MADLLDRLGETPGAAVGVGAVDHDRRIALDQIEPPRPARAREPARDRIVRAGRPDPVRDQLPKLGREGGVLGVLPADHRASQRGAGSIADPHREASSLFLQSLADHYVMTSWTRPTVIQDRRADVRLTWIARDHAALDAARARFAFPAVAAGQS